MTMGCDCKHFWRRLLAVVGWVTAASVALAENPAGEFQFWESPAIDALPQKVVKQTIQDGTGAMWFVTLEGLSRYDGHAVANFSTQSALGGGSIKGVDIDTSGKLWVVTNRQLLHFDQTLQQFVPTPHLPADMSLHTVTADLQGNLWLGTQNGVGIYRPATQRYEPYAPAGTLPEGSPVVDILLTEDDRRFALVEGRGLFEMDPTEKSQPLISSEQFRHAELWMVERVGNELWVATQGAGIVAVDLASGESRRIEANGPQELISDVVYHIAADDSGVWVSTAGGLSRFNLELKKFDHYTHSNSNLPKNWIFGVYKALDDSYWVSTNDGLLQGRGAVVQSLTGIQGKPKDADINAIFAEDSGHEWIGTDQGLHHRPPQHTEFRTIDRRTHPVLQDDVIMSLARSDDALWIGTFNGGLYRYLPEQDKMSAIPLDVEAPEALDAMGVTAILVHSCGQIVVATYGGGVSVLDAAGKVIRRIDLPEKSTSRETAFALLEDHDASVLVGSSAGLLRLNPDLSTLVWLSFDNQVGSNSVPGKRVRQLNFPVWELAHGKSNDLWLGTYNHGLLHWVRDDAGQTLGLHDLSDPLELPSRTVLGIHFGTGDDLWLSHNNGLTRLDTLTLTAEHFGSGFGAESINFNMGASFRGSDGSLYFGSDQGVKVLSPDAGDTQRPIVEVGIASIEVMGRPARLPSKIEPVALRLGYDDTLTTITFFSTDFTDPKSNAYAYRLVGLDDQWIQLGNGRSLNLNRLPSGQYTLEISVRDSSGNWHRAARQIALTVDPPWWQSILAYAVYSLLLTLLVRFLFWVHHNHTLASKYRALEAALHPDDIPIDSSDTEDATLRSARHRSSTQ